MPRAIWSGSVSFGLVNVPVKLYSAIDPKDLHFNQFEEGTGNRIRLKRVSEKTGKEVPYEKIVKGYEVSKGKYVMITPEELEAYEPQSTRTVEIEDFVDLDEIDPIYFERTYYLAPEGDSGGARKSYQLLLEAMEKKRKVGIGKMVMRTKQYLAAIRPLDGVLALSTMLFADEVRDRKEIDELTGKKASVSDREVKMASQIIDSLTVDWDPKRYDDTYRKRVLELIDLKARGETVEAGAPVAAEAKVVDLMAALEASLAAAKKGGSKGLQKTVRDAIEEQKEARDDADGDDYGSWSQEQLYEEAQRRKVPGRSKMGKTELVKALRKRAKSA